MFRSTAPPPRARLAPPRRVLGLVVLAALAASGCASSNRLGEVELRGRGVAVLAAIPPHPRIQAGDRGEAAINPYDPIGTAARVATAAAKFREARQAQARLDSAATRIDVADRIARRVLARSADMVGLQPVGRPADADFHLDLRVFDYALVSDSYEGATYFALEAEVRLIDARAGRELWRERLREREVLDASIFGMPAAVGNVVTARALGRLTEDEMARGLERLADLAADRIVERFHLDYVRSRR